MIQKIFSQVSRATTQNCSQIKILSVLKNRNRKMNLTQFNNRQMNLCQKQVYCYKQQYNTFGEEIDVVIDPQEDVQQTINHFLEFYARRDFSTPDQLVSSYYKLQGSRLGIRVKDPNFSAFLRITEEMIDSRQLKPSQVRIITIKLLQIGAYTSSIWQSILQYADKEFKKIDGTTYNEIVYTIYDSKSNNENKISEAILKSQGNILAFVQGVYLLSRIRDIKPQEKEQIRNIIINRQSLIYQNLDANQLADIIYLVYEIFNDELKQEDIQVFIKKTIDTFVIKDLSEYDSMLQQYEFMDRKNDEIGILDNLKWSSAAKILTILSDDEFFDTELVRRIEDLIQRKSETDVIDLESASILLENLSLIQTSQVSNILRILEMLDRRLQEEQDKAHELIHPQSIARIMNVLNHFLEIDIGLEFCDRLQNYFAGLVKSGDLDYKLTPEYLLELKIIFEESPICHLNKELFEHINKQLENKQTSKDQNLIQN